MRWTSRSLVWTSQGAQYQSEAGYPVTGGEFYREKMLPMRVRKGVRTGYLLAAAEFDKENTLPIRVLSTRE